MLGGLPSLLLNFVATHLVALSLLAFVAVGLQVLPAGRDDGTVEPAMATDEPLAPVPGPTAVEDAGSNAPTEPHGQGTVAPKVEFQPPAPEPASPRMIGGSLPIYGQQAPPPALPDRGMSFRPPDPGQFVELPPPTRAELVQEARRAFWNGDFEGAEMAYRATLSAYPDDADAYGELGNLYQSMGRDPQAMDAYFEAGIRLKAAGEYEKLQQIIDLFERQGDRRIHRLSP